MASLREKILAVADIPKQLVAIPEWDCEVEVRGLTAKARAAILNKAIGANGKTDFEKFNTLLVIYSAYDPDTGAQVFADTDFAVLGHKSSKATQRIIDIATELSGITGSSEADAAGNSESTLS